MRHSILNHKTTIAAAVILAAFASIAVVDTRPSGVTAPVGTQRFNSLDEHAKAVAYHVYRDYNQCLRTIPNSTIWSPAAYEIELTTCCSELLFGKALVDDLWGQEYPPLQIMWESACDSDDDGASVAPPTPEMRRTARMEALNAQPERFD